VARASLRSVCNAGRGSTANGERTSEGRRLIFVGISVAIAKICSRMRNGAYSRVTQRECRGFGRDSLALGGGRRSFEGVPPWLAGWWSVRDVLPPSAPPGHGRRGCGIRLFGRTEGDRLPGVSTVTVTPVPANHGGALRVADQLVQVLGIQSLGPRLANPTSPSLAPDLLCCRMLCFKGVCLRHRRSPDYRSGMGNGGCWPVRPFG
jgi:hypothetical protein